MTLPSAAVRPVVCYGCLVGRRRARPRRPPSRCLRVAPEKRSTVQIVSWLGETLACVPARCTSGRRPRLRVMTPHLDRPSRGASARVDRRIFGQFIEHIRRPLHLQAASTDRARARDARGFRRDVRTRRVRCSIPILDGRAATSSRYQLARRRRALGGG